MKHLTTTLLFTLLLAVTSAIHAQAVKVNSFKAVPDIISENDWRKDADNNYCALVKVRMVGDIERVEGNIIGNVIDRGSEKWIFLTSGTKSFRLYTKDELPLFIDCKDYGLSELFSKCVFILTLHGVQEEFALSDPLILKDSSLVKAHNEWYMMQFEVNIPFKSAVLQRVLSQALFNVDENSLELAYRRKLTSQEEVKSLNGQSNHTDNRIFYVVNYVSQFGKYATINAQHSRIQADKNQTREVTRNFSCIYDTEQDKIVTIRDIFVPDIAAAFERTMGDVLTCNISLVYDGIVMHFYKKGKSGYAEGKCLKQNYYKYVKNIEILSESFFSQAANETLRDVAIDRMSSRKTASLNINDIEADVTSMFYTIFEEQQKDEGISLYNISSELPEFYNNDNMSLEDYILQELYNGNHKLEGNIRVTFEVHPNGMVKNLKATDSQANELHNVSITLPQWKAGTSDGIPYKLLYIVDINTHQRERDAIKVNIYDVVEQMPSFVGGDTALKKFLKKNTKYPASLAGSGRKGACICTFVVEKDGSISNVKINMSLAPALDKEAIRVIETMPNWEPGRINGNPVRTRLTVPVNFNEDEQTIGIDHANRNERTDKWTDKRMNVNYTINTDSAKVHAGSAETKRVYSQKTTPQITIEEVLTLFEDPIISNSDNKYYVKHVKAGSPETKGDVVILDFIKKDDLLCTVKSIGDYAFYNCDKITSVSVPDSIHSFGKYSFSGCSSMTSVNIPNGITVLPYSVFERCESLKTVDIPESVRTIDNGAFSRCKGMTSLIIPNNVESIGKYAFHYDEGLTSMKMGESVEIINEYAFQYCSNLSEVVINKNIKRIDFGAFDGCPLKRIISHSEFPQKIDRAVFSQDIYKNAVLVVPRGTSGRYRSTFGWHLFEKIIEE